MLTVDFIWGLITGLLIAGVFGWLWGLYRSWVRVRDAYNRPQLLIQPTGKSPEQVAKAASSASLKITLMWFFLILLLWIALEIFAPGIAQFIRWTFGDIVYFFLGE